MREFLANGQIFSKRRAFLKRCAAGVTAAVGASLGAVRRSDTAQDATVSAAAHRLMYPDGRYDTVPLSKERIAAAVVQTRLLAVDPANARAGLRLNLEHLCDQVDATHGYFGHKDLVALHGFALQGWDRWDRAA
ncbi:MAG: hypothetical protein RML32_08775, partial [Gammaproteobacteria bacterium]|nr:hypothetical protein [Gammaproteobacteria bacterium]